MMADHSTFRFACPLCGHAITTVVAAIGDTLTCPGCSATVRIPAQGADPVAPNRANKSSPSSPPSSSPKTRARFSDDDIPGPLDILLEKLSPYALAVGRFLKRGGFSFGGFLKRTGPAAAAHSTNWFDAHRRGLLRLTLMATAGAGIWYAVDRWVIPYAQTLTAEEVQTTLGLITNIAAWIIGPILFLYLLRAFARLLPRLFRPVCSTVIWLGPIVASAIFGVLVALDTEPGMELFGVILGFFICLWFPPCLVWFFLGAWFARSMTATLLAVFVSTARCPGCREEYELVSQWACSCGYHDHRQRHFYLFKCPSCRNRLGHFNCERCDCTILL